MKKRNPSHSVEKFFGLLGAEWELDNGFVGPSCCVYGWQTGTSQGECVWNVTENSPIPAPARPPID